MRVITTHSLGALKMQKIEEPPSAVSSGDVMREIGRAAASIVPIAGGAIQVLFENIFASPLERRKKEWLESVAEAINDLGRKYSDITPRNWRPMTYL
jgi:hypothetical protein